MSHNFNPFKANAEIVDIDDETNKYDKLPYLHESYRKLKGKLKKKNPPTIRKTKRTRESQINQVPSIIQVKNEKKYFSDFKIPDHIDEDDKKIWILFKIISNLKKKNERLKYNNKLKPLKEGHVKNKLLSFIYSQGVKDIQSLLPIEQKHLIYSVIKKIGELEKIEMPREKVEQVLNFIINIKLNSDIQETYLKSRNFKALLILYYLPDCLEELKHIDNYDEYYCDDENKEDKELSRINNILNDSLSSSSGTSSSNECIVERNNISREDFN